MNDILGLEDILNLSLTTGEVIRNLAMALACGIIIARFYGWVARRPSYSRSFINSLIALALITAVVIMVIGNNLARAFGLVGAMSIVRFRTAVKDAQDIVFIFFSLAIGMAAGVGLLKIAFISTLFIGIAMTAVSAVQLHARKKREYLLQFVSVPTGDREPPYIAVLGQHCRRYHLVNATSHSDGDRLELAFYVQLKDESRSNPFVAALRGVEGVGNVSLFYDEEHD